MTNAYSYIKQSLKANLKSKMIDWRDSDSIVKLDKPSDIGKARMLGYKDKKGFIVVRVRLLRGGHRRTRQNHNRRSVRQTIRKNLQVSYRVIAESRAIKKYTNLEVLNSYYLAKDGQHYFFEVILVDPARPEIQASMPWVLTNRRTLRGTTSAGRKSRGLIR